MSSIMRLEQRCCVQVAPLAGLWATGTMSLVVLHSREALERIPAEVPAPHMNQSS